VRIGLPVLPSGGAQWREVALVDDTQRPDQARPDLGLGERARQRLHQRPAQMEGVIRELEVEERCLGLLVLAGRRQHEISVMSGLGHRDVDHDDELERLERVGKPTRVGERMGRVRTLHDHRPEAVGMVAEDLVRDHVAGD